jgi:hypothetical protein
MIFPVHDNHAIPVQQAGNGTIERPRRRLASLKPFWSSSSCF